MGSQAQLEVSVSTKRIGTPLIASVRLAPYVPVSLGVFAGASRLLKPGVLVRRMIQDHFDDDAYSPTMSRRQECLEILQ